jgi:hypothetical protein
MLADLPANLAKNKVLEDALFDHRSSTFVHISS